MQTFFIFGVVMKGTWQNQSRIRELDTEELLEQLPALQQLLHRLLGCQPEGAAISNYVIQAALSLCLKESFKLYSTINDSIIHLVDKAGRLVEFSDMCKGLNFARNFQLPVLEQEVDERHPTDLAASDIEKGCGFETPPAQPMPPEFLAPLRSAAQDLMEVNAGLQTERDLFSLRLYQPSGAQPPQVTGWELALVSKVDRSESAPTKRASGFDKQLLNSLYDDAIQRRFQAAAARREGSPVPSAAMNSFEDIFAASDNYAPPSPAAMAMMQPQAFLMQTQHRLTRMSGGSPFIESPASPQSSPSQLTSPPQLVHNQQEFHQNNPFGNPNSLL